ncbi:MAG: hypothetical protein H6707_08945 [Deltaproteobacteria bacterium]|nr:hypothetical protein [Deltaproteobacteria bacterium]
MPFDWYTADVPPISAGAKAKKMYLTELAERAALLLRLGYSKSDTLMRLTANVSWDFELNLARVENKQIKKVVEEVYQRKGLAGGGSPRLEG